MLEDALTKAIDALSGALFSGRRFGALEATAPERLGQVRGFEGLSAELKRFYERGNPRGVRIPWGAGELALYAGEEVTERQEGYAYAVGQPDRPEPLWDGAWLVIGDASGNPVIADVGAEALPILMAFHGMGTWAPRQVAPNLAAYLLALAGWLEVWTKRGGALLDDDFVMLDEVRAALAESAWAHLSENERQALFSFLE